MRNFLLVFALAALLAQETKGQDSLRVQPLRADVAALEVVASNLVVLGVNQFLPDADYAKVNLSTMEANLRRAPVWDNDRFSTNFFGHPYHGSTYFNAARSNGFGFWGSTPFVLGGSLMWEYLMETERPSINDLYTTTFGGISLGEITYRLSDLLIDETTRGWERFAREFFVFCISPARGINRLLYGQSLRHSTKRGNALPSTPIRLTLYGGGRYLFEQGEFSKAEQGAQLGFNLIYGKPTEEPYGDYYKPYEWFTLDLVANAFSSQPIITQINAVGILYGVNKEYSSKTSSTLGVFQHFDYYDSHALSSDDNPTTPYHISEAAAIGLGSLLVNRSIFKLPIQFRTTTYLDGILLGATASDYYKEDNRAYSIGSGASLKLYNGLTFWDKVSLDILTEHYYIYTWQEGTQGDAGHSHLSVIANVLTFHANPHWNIALTNHNYIRSTYYKHHPHISRTFSDLILTLGYTF